MRSKQLAETKMSEAGQWWEAFEIAVGEYRRYAIILVSIEEASRRLDGMGHSSLLASQIDWAHDMMLTRRENIQTCATCAASASIAARIYYEEYEEREYGKEQNPVDGVGLESDKRMQPSLRGLQPLLRMQDGG